VSVGSDVTATFLEEGFVRLPAAVPRPLARRCERLLWEETGYDPGDPQTWSSPVHWVLHRDDPPFVQAINSPVLVEAFDVLVGPGRWTPRDSIGAFPLRFPQVTAPDDDGWHIDSAFTDRDLDDADLTDADALRAAPWRVNVSSRGRALLVLMLFSDVGPADAPTRIRVGSHLDIPALLAPYGDRGAANGEIAGAVVEASRGRREVQAVGECGDVYVCHPFLVHAAQAHRGTRHRFLAQPGIEPAHPLDPFATGRDPFPVEQAIRRGLIGRDHPGQR
jgi:hypothetical protein